MQQKIFYGYSMSKKNSLQRHSQTSFPTCLIELAELLMGMCTAAKEMRRMRNATNNLLRMCIAANSSMRMRNCHKQFGVMFIVVIV